MVESAETVINGKASALTSEEKRAARIARVRALYGFAPNGDTIDLDTIFQQLEAAAEKRRQDGYKRLMEAASTLPPRTSVRR